MITLFALFAEVARDLISERTREGLTPAGPGPRAGRWAVRKGLPGRLHPARPRAGSSRALYVRSTASITRERIPPPPPPPRRRRRRTGGPWGQFLAWCEARGLGLDSVSPLHVAAYIRTHPGSVLTVKQHLAAIRVLCDWLVVSQVLPVNPAAAVRAEARRHQGRDASPDPGRGEEAPRSHRHGHAGRAPRPGALFGDALQLRAGERASGDEEAGLLPAGGAEGGSGSTRRAEEA